MTETSISPGWRVTTLGKVTRKKLNNGLFRRNVDYLSSRKEAGCPVVWVKELFHGNSIDTTHSRRVLPTPKELEKYGLKYGDILFCRSSLKLDGIAFNNVYLGDDDAALFECHLIRLSPDLKQVHPVFLNWLLRSPRLRTVAKLKAKTATMTTIDQKSLESIPFPLPPLTEQKRIAKILDAADALRTQRREAIAQLDALVQSTFLEMFGDPVQNPKGWEEELLSELGSLDRGVSKHRPRNDPHLLNGPYPLIQTGDVASSGGYIRSYSSSYSDFGLRQSKLWPAGTLCITIAANIANTGLLTFDACFPDSVVGFRSDTQGRTEYVQGLFGFLRKILDQQATQVAQKNINLKTLRLLKVPSPPANLQQEFAKIVASIKRQKTKHQQHLNELDDLFACLQQRAFNGEL